MSAVGLGSAALHTSLAARDQAGDELPMLWFNAALALCFARELEGDAPRAPAAGLALAYCVAVTAVYARTRENFAVFVANYASLVAVITACAARLALRPSSRGGARDDARDDARVGCVKPLFLSAVVCYYVFAIGWATEMMYCARATAAAPGAARVVWHRLLHPGWHVGAGLGAYLTIQVAVAHRGARLGRAPALRWAGLPFVEFERGPPSAHAKVS